MTNKEAINEIQQMKKAYCNTHTDTQLKNNSKIIDALDMAIKALEERPQGEWIEHYDCSDGFTWLTCSRCMYKAHEEGYNFCPNCGADMRGGRE